MVNQPLISLIKAQLAQQFFSASRSNNLLNASYLTTPLGDMLAIADANWLYLLDFADSNNLLSKIKRLQKHTKASITLALNPTLVTTKEALIRYFKREGFVFDIPLKLCGTPFQRMVWESLSKVNFGQTISYKQQAASLEKPKAYRAIANANGLNPLAIILPCHRIVNHSGKLGGYAGGLDKKQRLLDFEVRDNGF